MAGIQRVAAYLRVSTDRQAEEGDGLGVQESAVRKWAKDNGARIVQVFRDEGVSGAKELDHRPGLASALEAVRSGEVSGIVVYRLDRLARDLVLQEQLLADIRRLGGELYSTSQAEAAFIRDDENDPGRKMIRQILGSVAEYERSMIALRLRSGRARKHEQGGYAYGSPAYGYRAENGSLVEDEAEQVIIRRVLELNRQGMSTRAIAQVLNEEGHRTKRGAEWQSMTVSRLLTRSVAAA